MRAINRGVLLAAIGFLFSCHKKNEQVSPVEELITESVYASGNIRSKNQYEVFATVSGILENMYVREGDLVKQGDALFKISNTTMMLQAENASIAASRLSVAENREKLREQLTNVEIAREKLQYEATMLQRQRNLWKEEIGTRNDLDSRELAWQTAGKNYTNAVLMYEELKKELAFQEKQSFKNRQIAYSNLKDYTVKSSTNGKVFYVYKEKGEIVNAQTPIAVVGAANDFVIDLQVDEYDIARVKAGQAVSVMMDGYRGQVFEAVVQRVLPFMNAQSRSFTVEAAFMTQPNTLYPNLTCEANIVIREAWKALTIPRAYLLEGDYVLLKNKTRKKVTTGMKDYNKVEITGGLTRNDLILKPAL